MVAIFDSGMRPFGVSIRIWPRPSTERADSGSRTTSAKRRPPSTIWLIFSPSTRLCRAASTCGAGTPYCAAAA